MKTSKIIALLMVVTVLVSPVGAVFAAPASQESSIIGQVTELECNIDPATGSKTFLVTVQASNGTSQTVEIDQLTADSLGLITLTADGSPDCSPEALAGAIGTEVKIDSADIITEEDEKQHPVGSALATFFEDITTYDVIMDAHENGVGFGVIAQALWLSRKISSDLSAEDVFKMILDAKQKGDFSPFATLFEDGSIPQNWGQFRKAVLEGEKKGNLGMVMSNNENKGGGNGNGNGQGTTNGQTHNGSQGNHNKNDERGNNGKNEDRGSRKDK